MKIRRVRVRSEEKGASEEEEDCGHNGGGQHSHREPDPSIPCPMIRHFHFSTSIILRLRPSRIILYMCRTLIDVSHIIYLSLPTTQYLLLLDQRYDLFITVN